MGETRATRFWRRISDRILAPANGNGAVGETGPRWINRFAVVLVAGTFIWSLVHVILRQKQQDPATRPVLSLAHWQLEPGIRTGLNIMAQRYNAMRRARGLPEIIFKQYPISEKAYGQWVTTQLIGGTAPDLIEVGISLPAATWVSYRARYFVPLTQEIMRPNPYNAGTPLENLPWKETFIDSLGTPIPELQEYYEIGLSAFGVRIFYNQSLLKKLTAKLAKDGKLPAPLDEPPRDLRAFLKLCDLIMELKDERNRNYMSLAGSKYQMGFMVKQIIDPLTMTLLDKIDLNHNADSSSDETFFAARMGRLKFSDPQVLRIAAIWKEIARRFQPGWNGLDRNDAVQLFVRQQSLFFATGSWDASTLKVQAESSETPFPVGIAKFPVISPTDPDWGEFGLGPTYEKPSTSFPFAIPSQSPNRDLALDFLRFITTRENNQVLNDEIEWIPVIKGAEPKPLLKAFQPTFEGMFRGWNLEAGSRTKTFTDQIEPLMEIGEDDKGKPFSVLDWAEKMDTEWLEAAARDFEKRDEDERDGLRNKDALASVLRAKMLLAAPENRDYHTRHYFGYVSSPLEAHVKIQLWQAWLRETDPSKKGAR
jgi:raffinose/stachyose/melibiose transport system substrate-binding protein